MNMRQLTDEELQKYVDIVKAIVAKFPQPRREKVEEMMKGPIGEHYMTAPASTREDYHSAYMGGLMVHSLNVVQNLKKLADALCPKRWDNATLGFVGLFHDFGKIGDGVEPLYVPKNSDWHAKQGIYFEINKRCSYMPNSERGPLLLMNNGISLSEEEFLAIRLNDGPYAKENEGYRMHEPDLALLVHWADRWSCSQEKTPA